MGTIQTVDVIQEPLTFEEQHKLDNNFDSSLHTEAYDDKGEYRGFVAIQVEVAPLPIRNITTDSMLRRFDIREEVAILEGVDTVAKVIRDRLLSSPYADLDFKELQESVGYVVNALHATGNLVGNDPTLRLGELLRDGNEFEKYKGPL